MIRGGGNPLLEGKVEVSSDAQASQTDLIRDEVIELRAEIESVRSSVYE